MKRLVEVMPHILIDPDSVVAVTERTLGPDVATTVLYLDGGSQIEVRMAKEYVLRALRTPKPSTGPEA